MAFNILIKHSILPVKNYFVAGAVLAGAVFILIRILFSTPSLVTYTILYAFTPSSFRERESIDIEREVMDMKMAEYMESHIGEEFEGIISSITQFGFFVELPNTVDGLVHITDLTDDYYHYDEKNIMLRGERTGKTFKLSDKVKVRVIGSSKKERTVDFELVGMKARVKKLKTIHLNDKKVKTNRKKKGKINKARRFTRQKRR